MIIILDYIHKGVRAMLYDTGRQLQFGDPGNEQERREMLSRLELTLEMDEGEKAIAADRWQKLCTLIGLTSCRSSGKDDLQDVRPHYN